MGQLLLERQGRFRILGLCARAPFADGAATLLHQSLSDEFDWEDLVAAARRHRLVQPLLFTLKREGWLDRMDPAARCALEQRAALEARRSLMTAGQVKRIWEAFQADGIDALLLKGVGLTQRLYGRLDMRGAGDIDVLVRPDHLERAAARLTAMGLPRESWSRAGLPVGDAAEEDLVHHEVRHCCPSTGTLVEVHRRLTANPHVLPWDFDTLWARHETVRIGGVAVPVLSSAHEPLYLLVHALSHGWERLRWLADLAVMLRRPADMEAAIMAAAAIGLRPAMLHALALCRRWLGLPLPAAVEAEIRASLPARTMELVARLAMADGSQPDLTGEHWRAPLTYLRTRIGRYMLRQGLAGGRGYRLRELHYGLVKLRRRARMG